MYKIKDLIRRGPFTAKPGETWVDANLAVKREDELLDCIQSLVCQFATITEDGLYDSMSISAISEAMHLLAVNGRMVIEKQCGRRVLAKMI